MTTAAAALAHFHRYGDQKSLNSYREALAREIAAREAMDSECDVCGEMARLHRCFPYGVETFACAECAEREMAQDDEDNGQFGVGA